MATPRNYIKTSDVAGATDAQVALAEEIIDQYVGAQDRHVKRVFDGQVSSLLSENTVIDTSSESELGSPSYEDYFTRCVIEVLSGEAAGTIRPIKSSNSTAKLIQYDGTPISGFQVGDVFKIYQLAKFPRNKDVITRGQAYFKSIPIQVRDAVKAQVAYIIELGDDYFTGNDSDASSESIGNYSYNNGSGQNGGQSATVKMTAPQARTLLRGIMNRLGQIKE